MKMRIILLALILVGLMFVSGCNAPGNNSNAAGTGDIQKTADGKIICGDITCLWQNFSPCTPAELTMSSEGKSVIITI